MNESEPIKPANSFDSTQGRQKQPSRFRTGAPKESFLRRMRRHRLKYITILPSLVTIINGICGFAAITFASQATSSETGQFSYRNFVISYFAIAGYMILFAMVADMLDGRLARMSQSTSSFGGQLDSLCDIVSFGVAPAFIMLKMLENRLADITTNTALVIFLERFIWLMAAVYMSCAAIRLARFNVENEEDESAHMSFVGLPSPAAAGVIASLVIFQQQTIPDIKEHSMLAGMVLENGIIYSLPVLTLLIAVLMVSRVRYSHVVNQYIRGKKPFAHLIWILLFMGLIIWCLQLAFVVIFCGFAASGFVKWFYGRFFRRGHSALDESVASTIH
jgi:CDP-diacylglycerol---serine O-phosphatidyltransferase